MNVARVGVLLAVAYLSLVTTSAAQDARQRLARELAGLMLDETARRGLDDQVSVVIVRSIGLTLQGRLNRPLQEAEWRMLGDIITRFVADTLTAERIEELASEVYARHFDEAELRELLRFQRSEIGRKAARLTPIIGAATADAIDAEIRESPGMPRLLVELGRAFPVLQPQSP